MVSAADPRAAEAGAAMLRQGGSATDAALATLLALTVVEPQSSGIGGGGFLVHSDKRGGVDTFDGREEAPMAAGPKWFFVDGKPLTIQEAIPGGRSVGVPGNIRMMALAHAQHGKLPWKALFQPAIKLAANGYILSPRGARVLANYAETGALSAEARRIYYLADGTAKPAGTRIANPALAAFLRKLAERGPDSFYVGPNARSRSSPRSIMRRAIPRRWPAATSRFTRPRNDRRSAAPIAPIASAAWARLRRARRRSSRSSSSSSGSTSGRWARTVRPPGT